jgi:hypothetical protein
MSLKQRLTNCWALQSKPKLRGLRLAWVLSSLLILPISLYAADKPLSFNQQIEQLKVAKKVTLNFTSSLDCQGYCAPIDGFELNRAIEELESVRALSYVTTNQAAITKLIETLNKSVVKTPSPETPQLMYVNFLITFEMKDHIKTQLLVGKYYEADPTIEAELRNDKSEVKTLALDKMVHKTLRDWVLQYAQIDKERAFSNFQKECQPFYSSEIKYAEESLIRDKKILYERKGLLSPLEAKMLAESEPRWLARMEEYKAKLARCNDSDNPEYQKKLKRHLDLMLVNYFKNDASQVCDRHDLYHTDPNYCAARGEWQPSYNQWNVNNLEVTHK